MPYIPYTEDIPGSGGAQIVSRLVGSEGGAMVVDNVTTRDYYEAP